MASSILNDVKKVLGLDAEYTEFDTDIMIHINSIFMVLNELGVGPSEIFQIDSKDAVWDGFMATKDLAAVKSYIYLKVRLLFDPPTTSFALDSFQKQIDQMEWRFTIMPTTTTPEGRKNFHGYEPELPVRSLESLYADTAGDDD